MEKITKRILSGVQPSGDLHLGNYLGASLGNSIDNIGKIKSFPKKKQFENIVDEKVLKGDGFEIFKYFIAAQNIINRNNKFHIIKTHNFYGSVKNSEFSNKKTNIFLNSG